MQLLNVARRVRQELSRLVVAGGDDGWRGGSRGFDGVVERAISRPIVLDGRFEDLSE